MECEQEQKKSTHKVEVVAVEMQKHPSADLLSIIPVYGYTYVGRTADWVGVNKGAYLPPDSMCDVRRPEFSFLADKAKADGYYRVKAMKLRGVVSYGLMVPVPDDVELGSDWAERLGVLHYEPEIQSEKGEKFMMGGEVASAPNVVAPKYDVDAFRRYHTLFVPGEPVQLREKLDGCNFRCVYMDGKMHCGSRTEFKKEYPDYSHLTVETLTSRGMPEDKAKDVIDRLLNKPKKKNLWWEALERNPALEKFCRDNPGSVVYSEIFGNINCIKYGFADGINRVATFDILMNGHWVDALRAEELSQEFGLVWAPRLTETASIPYDFDAVCALSEGSSIFPGVKTGTIREGLVIRPLVERYDHKAGRVNFKIVNPTYLERYR